MGVLDGKRALVYGVANRRSIAWAIAQALSKQGARLALTYQGERLEKMARECAEQIPGTMLIRADVTDDAQIQEVYNRLGEAWGGLDTVVHSIAYADAEDLSNPFVETSRAGFTRALEISAYSLIAVTRGAVPLMPDGGSVMTMTYIASERVFPSYNVMGVAKAALESTVRYLAADIGPRGVRVNAISAGPISTLAARGVPGFTGFARAYPEKAPLRRATDPAEVGDTAVFLASDWSRGITGEVIFVDEGFHAIGV
ncbi:MAG TPA: enoyl-ACP reductase [Chloroflexota bacterium]|nr:enoyl-ACP reductase [Chloroflexota bacterium]